MAGEGGEGGGMWRWGELRVMRLVVEGVFFSCSFIHLSSIELGRVLVRLQHRAVV